MRQPPQKALTSVAKFAAAIALCVYPQTWPTGTSDHAPQSNTIRDVLARAGKATPYLYSGAHAENLNHLWPAAPKSKKVDPGANITSTNSDNPVADYNAELAQLKKLCPSLQHVSASSFNPSTWFLQVAKNSDVAQMPRNLAEAAYHTIGRSPESRAKVAALTILHKVIPDSPEYLDYLDEKRAELHDRINADASLQLTDEQWVKIAPAEKEAILGRIAALTMKTLLPNNDVDVPRVIYATKNYPSATGSGRYSSTYNDVYIDGSNAAIRTSFGYAKEIATHEAFHAFASILANWYAQGKLALNMAMQRQGKIYQLSNVNGGSAINIHTSSEGYRTSFGERGAWAFQLAASGRQSADMATEAFISRDEKGTPIISWTPPVYKIDPSQGQIPPSCQDSHP